MLSVILLSMLMILFSLLIVIRVQSEATTWIGFWTWIWSMRHWTGVRSGMLISMLGKLSWFCFYRSNNNGSIGLKMDGSVLEEKSSFKVLGLTSSKLDWGSYLISIAKTDWKFVLWGFFLLSLLCISINLPYGHVWNTVVTTGLVPLVATWNCQTSYKNQYAWLFVLHMLLFLNRWLIVKMWPT